jgi:hypothetical protein
VILIVWIGIYPATFLDAIDVSSQAWLVEVLNATTSVTGGP